MRRAALVLALAALAAPAAAQSLEEAQAKAAARDYAGAARILEQRLQAAPTDAESRYLLARIYAWSGEPARAMPLYEALLAAEPANGDYLLGYGQALLWSGRAREAVDVLERAHAIAPDYAEVDTALAQARATTAAETAPAASPTLADDGRVVTASRDHRSVALSARRDRLDRGLDDWRSVRLDMAWRPEGRTGVYGAVLDERRFGLRDAGVELGAILPLGRGWSFQPEIGVVPDAQFLPETYVDLRVQRTFGGGWVGSASWRRSDYREVDVQRVAAGVEHYAGAWRVGYTLGLTRLAGRSSPGHDLRVVRGYGERSEVGLQLGAGREVTLLGPVVVTSEVRAATLFGRHAVGDWALLWNVGRIEQGDFYTRDGIGLGLERRF